MGEEKCRRIPEVQCPFFSSAGNVRGGRKIFCESPVPGSSLSLYFRKKEDFEMQMGVFCCDHYRNCEIYRMVMKSKYEEE